MVISQDLELSAVREKRTNAHLTGQRNMEQRMNIRVPVDLPVSVHFAGRGNGPRNTSGTIRNLSFDGALVEAGGTTPEQGMPVRVELHTNPLGSFTLDALVLRHEGRGLGLLFAHYGDAVFEKLAGLLEPELDKRYGRPAG